MHLLLLKQIIMTQNIIWFSYVPIFSDISSNSRILTRHINLQFSLLFAILFKQPIFDNNIIKIKILFLRHDHNIFSGPRMKKFWRRPCLCELLNYYY